MFLLVIPLAGFSAVSTPTVNVLDEDGLVIAGADSILVSCNGTGTAPDGDQFINTERTWVIVHAQGHDAALTVTIEPQNRTEISSTDFGAITVANLTHAIVASDANEQIIMFQIPKGYNSTAGKALVKITSAGAFVAGEVQIAVVRLERR